MIDSPTPNTSQVFFIDKILCTKFMGVETSRIGAFLLVRLSDIVGVIPTQPQHKVGPTTVLRAVNIIRGLGAVGKLGSLC